MTKLPPGMRDLLVEELRVALLEWAVAQVESGVLTFPGIGIALVKEPKGSLDEAIAQAAALPRIEVVIAQKGNEIVVIRNPGVTFMIDHAEIEEVIEVAGELDDWNLSPDRASRLDSSSGESRVDVAVLACVIARLLE
ncbi:MAG: hypothetical protein ABIZ50_01085 [Solirubrobacterales bacterium]